MTAADAARGGFPFEGPVEVIAHRGFSARAPENTLAAVEAAVRAGADALEFDLHTAADGTAFLFHDETLERTTQGRGRFDELSPEEVAALDAGSWFSTEFRGEPVPTLEAALLAADGRFSCVYPEIKGYGSPADIGRMVGVARDTGALDRTVFISLDWAALEGVRAVSPGARIGYVVSRRHPLDEAFARATGDAGALLDFDARILLADPEVAARAREAGIEMAAWTVDRPDDAARLLELGVPRITTNRVDEIVGWRETL